jgi:hypothetical protein
MDYAGDGVPNGPVPSYEIRVRSDEPIRASQAMHKAQLPTIDWAGAGFVRTPTGDWTVGKEFTVFVTAENISQALGRLRRVNADFEIVAESEPLQS